VFCNRCGHENVPHSAYCSSCGAELREPSDETTAAFSALDEEGEPVRRASVQMPATDNPMLVVERGPSAGSRFLVDQDLVRVGRHPDADILLDDVTVSRKHAEIVKQGSDYVVRDAGSLNGTYLNRQRVDEAPLRNGDEVQIGKFRLVFYGEAATSS
jgi:hypothetical protein